MDNRYPIAVVRRHYRIPAAYLPQSKFIFGNLTACNHAAATSYFQSLDLGLRVEGVNGQSHYILGFGSQRGHDARARRRL